MLAILQIILVFHTSWVRCFHLKIDGLSYMDPIRQKPRTPDVDPCNPLYWYPRERPEYCDFKPVFPPMPPPPPPPPPIVPLPVPVPPPVPPPCQPPCPSSTLPPGPPPPPPIPLPIPVPIPFSPSFAPLPPFPFLSIQYQQVPFPMPPQMYPSIPQPSPFVPQPYPPPQPYPLHPIPYGIPLAPTNPMLPVAPQPFIPPPRRRGLVPGVPGLVSPDGGINIMPFSDVYSELLEKHKERMVRKKMEKYLKKYERRSGRDWSLG